MLQLSVLFVVLYSLSFIWFKTGWKRWLFLTVLVALPMVTLSILFFALALTFSAAPTDLPDPTHLGFFVAAQSAYFALILILCEAIRWALIGVGKMGNKMASTRIPRVHPTLATGLVLLAGGGLIWSLDVFFGADSAVSPAREQALSANRDVEKIAPHILASTDRQPNTLDWNPQGGWLRLCLIDAAGTRRFFVSYRGRLIEVYFGWKPSGSFGIALRKAQARLITGPRIGNRHHQVQPTNPVTCWQALLYLETPQSGYHPTWPAWLRSVGWWIRNPFPGLTEFWLGLRKPLAVYEQIDDRWQLRQAT
jgi:hypothetical protein